MGIILVLERLEMFMEQEALDPVEPVGHGTAFMQAVVMHK